MRNITLSYNAKKLRARGFSLLETALALAITGAALAAMLNVSSDSNLKIKDAAVADRLTEVYQATLQYMAANSSLSTQITPGTNVVVPVGRTSATGAVPAGSLQALGYLPSTFIDNNAYGQTTTVTLNLNSTGAVQALVATTGGQTIPDNDLGRIAAKVGAPGGDILSSPPPGVPAGTMLGTGGGWSELASDWSSSSGTPTAGHAVAVSYATQVNLPAPYLYRNKVAGLPQANQMSTDIDMQHHQLNAVSDLNNTDTTSGATAPITVDSNLQGTAASQVNFVNGLYACKTNTVGCGVQVGEDGKFIDNNDGWVTYQGAGTGTGLLVGAAGSTTGDNLKVTGLTTGVGGGSFSNYLQSYGNVQMKSTGGTYPEITWPDANGNWSAKAYLDVDTSQSTADLLRLYNGNLQVDGTIIAASDQAKIYYDLANESYYVQPSATSNVNILNAVTLASSGATTAGTDLTAEGGTFTVRSVSGAADVEVTGKIRASGTVTGTGGLQSGLSETLGGGCSTAQNGLIAVYNSGTNADGSELVCHANASGGYSWQHSFTPFRTIITAGSSGYHSVAANSSQSFTFPSSAGYTNTTSDPEIVQLSTATVCAAQENINITATDTTVNSVVLNSTGLMDTTGVLVLPPGHNLVMTASGTWNGTNSTCGNFQLELIYTMWGTNGG